MNGPGASRFEGIRPLYAWLLLTGLLALCTYGVFIHSRTQKLVTLADDQRNTDYSLYQRIIDRVHAGEGYYEAAGSELREGKFPLRPFMTWRLPTLAKFMAMFSTAGASRVVIAVMFLVALGLWVCNLKEGAPVWMPIIGGILLFLCLGILTFPPCHLYHETWSGLCIALSLGMYGRGYWRMSVLFGVLAVFLRELALPFVVIMLAMAWWERRRGEALGWCLGLVCFVAFLGMHAWMVSRQLTGGERVSQGWLYFGGWPFVIKTARANVLLLATPSWVAGIVLPLAILGLAAWSNPVGTRLFLITGAYVAAFLFAGRPIQAYWGLMYAQMLPLGLVFVPRAIRDLVRAAVSSRQATAHLPQLINR